MIKKRINNQVGLRTVFPAVSARVNSFITQRDALASELNGIIKEAQSMLTKLAGENLFSQSSQTGRQTKRSSRSGRRKGFKMSAAAKAKIARAQKARWARAKEAKG